MEKEYIVTIVARIKAVNKGAAFEEVLDRCTTYMGWSDSDGEIVTSVKRVKDPS